MCKAITTQRREKGTELRSSKVICKLSKLSCYNPSQIVKMLTSIAKATIKKITQELYS